MSNKVDEKIQQTLGDETAHCTILIVAHRLHIVIASDRIVVMDKGSIAEIGILSKLLSGPSMLSDLVYETGPDIAAHPRQLAFAAAAENDNDVKQRAFAHPYASGSSTSNSNETAQPVAQQDEAVTTGANETDDGRSLKMTMSDESNVNESDLNGGVLMNGGDANASVR